MNRAEHGGNVRRGPGGCIAGCSGASGRRALLPRRRPIAGADGCDYFDCVSECTYAATAAISAADSFAPPIGGIGAGCCFGFGTPLFTMASMPARVGSVFSHSPSVRSGASGVPFAAGPWHVEQSPLPVKIFSPCFGSYAGAGAGCIATGASSVACAAETVSGAYCEQASVAA